MLVKQLVAEFLAEHKRNNKPATVKLNRYGLKWFLDSFGERPWDSLERAEVLEAMDRGNRRPDGKKWEPDTIRRNIGCYESLQAYALDEGETNVPLRPRDLKKPTGTQREAIPTETELADLMAMARAIAPELELAFQSLVSSGMRPNELCAAQIDDLNPARDLITLADHKTRAKSGRAKTIPLGDHMKGLVALAIGERTEGPIWIDHKGRAWTGDRLGYYFRRIKTRVGMADDLVLYSLRHWKGTQVAREFDILAAKTVLGHSDIATTARYAHPSDDDARKWQDGKSK